MFVYKPKYIAAGFLRSHKNTFAVLAVSVTADNGAVRVNRFHFEDISYASLEHFIES